MRQELPLERNFIHTMSQDDRYTDSQTKTRQQARGLFWLSCATLPGTFLMVISITAGLASLAITFVLWFMCFRKLGVLKKNAVQHEQTFVQEGTIVRMKIEQMRDTREHFNSNNVIELTLSFPDAPDKQLSVSAPLSALALDSLTACGFADIYYLEHSGQARLVPIDQVFR